MMKSYADIQFFLRMGYFPDYATRYRLDYSLIDRAQYEDVPFEKLIDIGAMQWRETIGRSYQGGKRNVVPLSGGLDSRAILTALLENTEAANIETYTFGTPGTLDYELGCKVAKAAGTRHTAIRLDDYAWEQADFEEAAVRLDYQTFLFHHAPMKVLDQFKDGVIWSGYIGDVVTGGHCPAQSSTNPETAKARYLKERAVVRSMKFLHADFKPFLDGVNFSPDFISYDEQILLAEIGKVTAPHVLMRGFNYKTPFINSPFWAFSLGVPDEYRRGQKLYKAILKKHWPQLFKLPTKSDVGLAARARNRALRFGRENLRGFNWPAHPMTNYTDLDALIRRDKNLADLMQMQIFDLKQRDLLPDLDIEAIWVRHMARRGNHADILKMLFSLELNLKGLEKEDFFSEAIAV